MFKFLTLTSLLLIIGSMAENEKMVEEDFQVGGTGLRKLQTTNTKWKQGFDNRPIVPGYYFTRDTGSGYKDTFAIRNNGQLTLFNPDGGHTTAITFGNEWRMASTSIEFNIFELGGNVPFRIRTGAPLHALEINPDGSIGVASGIVANVNLTQLELDSSSMNARLSTIESAMSVVDGNVAFNGSVTVKNCIEQSGTCPDGPARRHLSSDLERKLSDFENENNKLKAMVEALSNRLTSLEQM